MSDGSSSTARDPLVRTWLLLTPGQWVAVLLTVVVLLAMIEVGLRTGIVWRLPLPYLLSYENDRYMLVSWELHQPQPPGAIDVMAFGSSMAAAVTELPGNEAPRILRDLSGQNVRFLVMAVPRGCFDEMTIILENLIDHKRPPKVAVLFTWPGCFIRDNEQAVRAAHYMPLKTRWLADDIVRAPLWERTEYALVQHIDVLRYRYAVNAWLRRRLDSAAFEGKWRLYLPYRPYRLSKPAKVPLDQLPGVARYRDYPDRVDLTGRDAQQLDKLLTRLSEAGIRTLLVENPWSSPIEQSLSPLASTYHAEMARLAAEHGISYVNPNDVVDLDGYFNDLLHLTHDGGRRYFAAIAPHVVAALR